MSFVHLHVHTEQSLLDGLSKADELISAAYQDGQPAVACTDHGSLGMTRQLVTAAQRLHQRLIEHGDLPADSDPPVKPILGIEAYLSIGSRHERNFTVVKTDELAVEDSEGKSVHGTKQKRYDHLTLLAVNTTGWRNLLRLHRASYESFWYKPRMDFELLAEHSEGIIALSGCLGGPVAGPLSRGESDTAAANLDRLIDIFGHDNVYVELMDHGIGIERNIVVDLIALADERDLPIVASNDCHYTHCDDAEAHDAWLALQSGRWSSARLDDPKRFRFNGSGYHLRTEAEMRGLFDDADPRDFCLDDEGMDVLRQRWDEACDTTVELADRIAFDAMPEPTQRLPRFPVPQSFTVPAHREHAIKHPVIDGRLDTSTDVALTDADHYLYRLVQLGAAQRWGYSDGTGRTRLPDNVKTRLREEFDIVAGMGFSDYFLIVADLVSWARDNGIAVGPGRGCLTEDALIWVKDRGYVPIPEVRIGDVVRSHTGSLRSVESTFRYDVDEPTVKIRAYGDGRGIEMTRDHKLLIVRGQRESAHQRAKGGAVWVPDPALKREWVEAGSVRPGDLVCIPRPKPTGEAPRIIDVADLLPSNTGSTIIDIADDEIIERTPVNFTFDYSVRKVSLTSGVSRNTIRHLLDSSAPDSGAMFSKNGRTSTATMRARDTLVAYLQAVGFSGLADWKRYLDVESFVVVRTPRYIAVDDDLLFLLGAVASNGWLLSGSRRRLGIAEQRSAETSVIPDLFRRVFGVEPRRIARATTDVVQWDIYSTAVRALFSSLLPGYEYTASTKALPEWVLDLDGEHKRSLLDGLWWGDGCTSSKWSYTTSSPSLMVQVRDLLWSIGSSASVNEDDRVDSRREFANRSKSWKITATPGLTSKRLTAQFGHVDEDYVYQRVYRIDESHCSTQVFDIQVAVDHSFMTDSFIVHNSSAGSAMSYALGIVGVDPLRYHLLFERFLEPGRVGMPDIDIDFEKARRDEVIAYLASRWGADTVAKIGTYGVSLSRRSFQSAARLLDRIDLGELSKTIPIHGGKPASLQAVTDETDPDGEEFRRAVAGLDAEDQEAVKQILDLAGPMEGAVMDSGIHACGILIADQPLVDIVPLRLDTRSKAGSGRDGYPVTEWDCNEVEAYGLLKMDVLGLRTLDILTEACRTVSTQTGTDIDPTTIPDPDDSSDPRVKAAWALISDARTAGVFQLEGSGMAEVCEQIRPSSLEELAAVVALYRPGPIAARMPQLYADRKWGRAEVDYSHYTDDPAEQKAIAGVLDETQGCLIYQEQLMRLSRTVAGFDAVWRSKLRKAVGKKKAEIMAEVGEKFLADAVTEMTLDDGTHKPAFSRACAEALWEDFKGSASYSFNASHAVAYAQLAYMTAYLKASWPAAYGAALLSMTKDDDKRLAALHSLAAEGVDVAGPDVNLSGEHTAPVTPEQVALGLSEVKGVGAAGAEIVAQRLAGGQYTSLGDLASRCPSVTSAVLAALIEAGACDAFGPRRGLFMAHRAAKKCPQVPVSDSEWPSIERGRRQRDVLGLVVAAEHPMRQLGDFLRQWKTERSMSSHTPLSRVHELDNGESVNVFGIVRSWQQRVSKAGNLYARFVLENASTSVEGIVFASALEPLARQKIAIAAGDLVNLRGRVSIREQFQLPNGHTSDESPDEDGSQAADHVAEVTAEIIVSSAERIDTGEEPSCDDPPVDMSALVNLYTDGLDSESPGEEPDDDGDDDGDDDDEGFEDDNGRFDVSEGLHGWQPPATAPPAAKPSARLQHPTPAASRPSPVVMRRENRNAAYRQMSTVTGNAVLLVAGGFEPPALFADGQKCGESSPFAIRWSTRRSAVSPGLTFGADTGEIPPGIHLLTLNLGASAEQVTLIVLDPLTHSWPHSCADALASSDGRLTTAGVAAAATTELVSADSFSVHAGCISTDVHLTGMTAAGTG